MDRNIWIYDIEQFPNFHCSTWLNIDTQEIKTFTISIFTNELSEYRDFICSGIIGIGFNNLNYDYPMLDYLITVLGDRETELLNQHLYLESQRLVNTETPKFNRIKNPKFPQIDLYTIHHFDNKAKATSLKQLEIVMELDNVEDLPYKYDSKINNIQQQEKILAYNYNDVYATYQFFLKSVSKIQLRQNIKKETNLDCVNWSDSKLGEYLFQYEYCKLTGDNPYNINQLRTNRDFVKIKDIIQDFDFKSPHLIKLYEELKKVVIYNNPNEIENIENKLEYKVTIKSLVLDIKKGGIHGSLTGIFKENNTHIIKDIDVASLYPSLYITLEAVPEHLHKESFISVAKNLVTWRKQNKAIAKSDKNAKLISDTYKLALNSVYGKFKDKYSWLYDIACTFKVTINGQLFLLKLLEDIAEINDCQIIQANTDGITVYINRNQEKEFNNIYNAWEKTFKMELEEVEYKSMFIRDVNNYIALPKEGKLKFKGAYVPDIKADSVPDSYHKDYSNQISVLACIEYFINKTPLEQTIRGCYDIRRFSLKERCKRSDKLILSYYNGENIITNELSRTVRFYVAKSYKKIHKEFSSGKISSIVAGYNVEIINQLPEEFPINIDYEFYILEAKKLVDEIEDNRSKKEKQKYKDKQQLNLF